MQCPNCQHSQQNEIACESCGIYFEKWRRREEEIKQVRTTIYAEPNHSFRNFGLGALVACLILFIAHKFSSDDQTPAPIAETAPAVPATPAPPTDSQSAPTVLKITITRNSAPRPANDPSQRAVSTESLNAYRTELRNLRNQQSQVQRDLNAAQRSYTYRGWPGADEAQAHADQANRQQKEQELSAQLDSINSQINFLMSHPPGTP